MLIETKDKRYRMLNVGVHDRTLILDILTRYRKDRLSVEYGSHFEAMKVMEDIVTVRDTMDDNNLYVVFPLPTPDQFRTYWCSTGPLAKKEAETDPAPDQIMDDLKMELTELH